MPTLDLSKSALAVIDMQRYFLDEDGEAYLGAPKGLVENVLRLIGAFRDAGRPVLFTRHAHARGADAGQMGRWWDGRLPFDGEPQAELIGALEPLEGERILTKTRYSAFEGTDLDSWLRERGVDTLALCGVMTNLCVETTARHAFMKDLQPVIAKDACASNSRDMHSASIANLEYGFAFVKTTSSIVERMEALR